MPASGPASHSFIESLSIMRVWSEGQHENSAFASSEESRWSRRCYNCNFCEREFKSAQALGGHMNVHRRDRALLRLSSDSNSASTFLPSDNTPTLIVTSKPRNSLLGEGKKCLPQETHWALPISPDNRNPTPYPFFHFFDTSSSNSGSHDHTQYSNKEDICRFRCDALCNIPFELSIEQSPSPSVVRSRDGADLEIKMDCRAVCGHNVHNNVGLDLELRLGYTSSSRPSL